MIQTEKFKAGIDLFKEIHGGLSAEETVNKLKEISPQLAQYSIEWIFGDLYANKTIDMKTREIGNISALIAIGALPQLRNHINAAFHLGFSKEEIEQIILNTIIIVGFPAVVNAMLLFQEIIKERNEKNCV